MTQVDVHYVNTNDVDFSKILPEVWMTTPLTTLDDLQASGNASCLQKMEGLCMQLQGMLCREIENVDGKAKFLVDKWHRKSGDGGGVSCVLEDGAVFERAGVNISVISGVLGPKAMYEMKSIHKGLENESECSFSVCGISSVIHPLNPYVPTTHFNFRYFEIKLSNNTTCWWFGGGSDLTPYYLFEEDAIHFHEQLKRACDRHDSSYYPRFKAWCDEYFFLKHRGEARGIGGLFFDDLTGESPQVLFEFVRSCAEAIIPGYIPIVKRRKDMPYTEQEREWQLIRRGRYVEFNLIYDRGTKFGLFTPDARIESILVSLPLNVKWMYCYDTTKDARNQKLLDVLTNPRDWLPSKQ